MQSQYEASFAERMFVYHYRLHDRYRQRIVSLAVLGDDQPAWKPDGYHYELWDCALDFRFPIVKMLDYAPQQALLEANANPFATVVLAHLTAQETHGSDELRAVAKFALIRRLYELATIGRRFSTCMRLLIGCCVCPTTWRSRCGNRSSNLKRRAA